jgi:hypothetical protein
MTLEELPPSSTSTRFSFYGKALVLITDDGDMHLFSYLSEVAVYYPDRDCVVVNKPQSKTTMRHIDAFIEVLRMRGKTPRIEQSKPNTWQKS